MAVCTIHLSAMLKKESNAYFLSHGACLHKRGDSSSARQIDFSIAADEELSGQILPVDASILESTEAHVVHRIHIGSGVQQPLHLCHIAVQAGLAHGFRSGQFVLISIGPHIKKRDAVAALLHDLFISLRDALEGFRIATWLIWVRLERKLAVGGFNLSIGSVTPDAKHLVMVLHRDDRRKHDTVGPKSHESSQRVERLAQYI